MHTQDLLDQLTSACSALEKENDQLRGERDEYRLLAESASAIMHERERGCHPSAPTNPESH